MCSRFTNKDMMHSLLLLMHKRRRWIYMHGIVCHQVVHFYY